MRHPHLLSRTATLLLVVDVQERLAGAMCDHPGFVAGVRRLLDACRLLGVPALATEQYPKGLGPTLAELGEFPDRVEKLTFSCWGEPSFRQRLRAAARPTVLLAGIEAHVCVSQTAHDLLAAGFVVQVAADAVSSRRASDRDAALARMARAGVILTTVESAIFELLETAAAPEFKAVHGLVK